MSMFHLIFFIWVLLSVSLLVFLGPASCFLHQFMQQANRRFEQKTDRFWVYQEESNSWVELELPFDLVSCVDDKCTKVGVIDQTRKPKDENFEKESDATKLKDGLKENKPSIDLPQRKRISLTKMSDSSIWITGESGAIYERFWNGVQWVIAPHDWPLSAGHAKSVLIVNQTILGISEEGNLYQMQLSESSQPMWVDVTPTLSDKNKEAEQNSVTLIKSGVVSHNGVVYFCAKNAMLLELREVHPISQTLNRWENHGRPPGADVAAIAGVTTIRTEVVYTISSAGDLYEFDKSSRPSWKKHIQREEPEKDGSFIPLLGCVLHGLNGENSVSLFLLAKGGQLVERRFYQRKWKWITHASPENHSLTSITPLVQDERNEKVFSLFFTTSTGSIFEYQIPKSSGTAQETQVAETWLNHAHPLHAKVARGILGQKLQPGRLIFPLDDGRLAELHMPGFGGETSKPKNQVNSRKRASAKYVWTVLDAPETEGWNAEYCTEERGPMSCMAGIKDETNDAGMTRSLTRRRRGNTAEQNYLSPATTTGKPSKSLEEYKYPDNWINNNFRLRVMHESRSFFLATDSGFIFEYLYAESVWIWLRHDHPTPMQGALGNYNGSLFCVDIYGSLLIRERRSSELEWINCTSMRKGRQVIAGPSWDRMPGKAMKATADDALFFVSKTGKLLQFIVALRKFKWKDCRHPSNTKVASIVDQEMLRDNIVFVIGRNGRLYQYNKVTELWHEHHQSQHLVLSRVPGAAMRPSKQSLTGSLFMLSEDRRLVEYHWNVWDGWNWVEHGTPSKDVVLGGPPGPCFEGNQLFLIGSDGNVYLRLMDELTWRWQNCGFPSTEGKVVEDQTGVHGTREGVCLDKDFAANLEKDSANQHEPNRNCDPKVAPTRPIPFSEDSVVFELRDGRLAEMRRVQEKQWGWLRIIDTPTSLCPASYWTALAS